MSTPTALDRLVFGCGPIGSYAADGDSASGQAALAMALETGISAFDVAPSYGNGHAERLLGEVLAPLPRDMVQVATKVGRTAMANANPYARPVSPGDPRGGGAFDFSAAGVRAALEASLERLGLDRVEIAYLHDPELAPELVVSQSVPALTRLRESGLVGAVGVASTNPEATLEFVRGGQIDVVMIAAAWTLTRRTASQLLDECHRLGVGVQVAAPFDSGLLASAWPTSKAPSGYRVATPEALTRARTIARICESHGASLPQAALQFPLRHAAVTAVVTGMRSAQEVVDDIALLADPVPLELWEEIDAALSGPAARGVSRRSTP